MNRFKALSFFFLLLFLGILSVFFFSAKEKKGQEDRGLLEVVKIALESERQYVKWAQNYFLRQLESKSFELDYRRPYDVTTASGLRLRIPSLRLAGVSLFQNETFFKQLQPKEVENIEVFQSVPGGLLRIAGGTLELFDQQSILFRTLMEHEKEDDKLAFLYNKKNQKVGVISAKVVEGFTFLKSLKKPHLFVADLKGRCLWPAGQVINLEQKGLEVIPLGEEGLLLGKQVTSKQRSFPWIVLGLGIFIILGIQLVVNHYSKNERRKVRQSTGALIKKSEQLVAHNRNYGGRFRENENHLNQVGQKVGEMVHVGHQKVEEVQKVHQVFKKTVIDIENGAQLSVQAEEAMSAIVESSSNIKKFVSLVEEIAFQTNILAINAAIEAARAGEQGKGFAVVAMEVRELAFRSADAAKEIHDLVAGSLSHVEKGATLVRQSGSRLSTIASEIKGATELIEKIVVVSQKESTTLADVSQMINSLNQSTQANLELIRATLADGKSLSHGIFDLKKMLEK